MVLLLTAGCGIMGRSRPQQPPVIPPSHADVAEMAVSLALGNAGIPSGDGRTVECRVATASRPGELALPVAREFLLSRQYRLVEHGSDIPVISITIDTLAVTLASEDRGLVRRTAVSGITVRVPDSGGTRSVYRGTGTSEDFFASEMLQTLNGSEPFVNNQIPEGNVMRRVRPVLIAVTMTLLGWMLYSYRG